MGLRWSVCVGCLVVAAGIACADIVEEETGIHFPDRVELEGRTLEGTGAGVREKLWFDVYAAALYVDPAALRKALGTRYRGKDAAALRADEHFYNDLIYARSVPKVLVIRMARDVDADTMREAFEEALTPHMQLDEQARAFMAQLDRDLKEGDEVRFEWLGGGKVRMVFGGRKGKVFHHPKLAASLLKIWLGPKPASKDIKRKVLSRMPGMLSGR
ncbi:MAG: hypothetical protein D6776_01975 [Planctomycetota bacterium]|nr:MAG: hypothetical protein D6776_01975 [Planctomycetota bacterium]